MPGGCPRHDLGFSPRANGDLNGSFHTPDGSLYTPFWQVPA
jgi:hypothetical protein